MTYFLDHPVLEVIQPRPMCERVCVVSSLAQFLSDDDEKRLILPTTVSKNSKRQALGCMVQLCVYFHADYTLNDNTTSTSDSQRLRSNQHASRHQSFIAPLFQLSPNSTWLDETLSSGQQILSCRKTCRSVSKTVSVK